VECTNRTQPDLYFGKTSKVKREHDYRDYLRLHHSLSLYDEPKFSKKDGMMTLIYAQVANITESIMPDTSMHADLPDFLFCENRLARRVLTKLGYQFKSWSKEEEFQAAGAAMRGEGPPMRGMMRGGPRGGRPMRGGPMMRGRGGPPMRGGPMMRGGPPMRGGGPMRGMRGGPREGPRGRPPMRGGPMRGGPMRGGPMRGGPMRGGAPRGAGPMRGKRPGQQPDHTAFAKDAKKKKEDPMARYERYMAGYTASAEESYDIYDSYYGQQAGYTEEYGGYSEGYDEGHSAADAGHSGGGTYEEGYAQALAEVKKAVLKDMKKDLKEDLKKDLAKDMAGYSGGEGYEGSYSGGYGYGGGYEGYGYGGGYDEGYGW